ncbi:hypothetical protein LCGC14_0494750 [marine sediment metagenome]|uniref:Thioredoxin domain-containing protein n=1 Tax=marine sediment metagenome TaxID=412755 RepID=A0A0F9SAQ8_9ZZZZ
MCLFILAVAILLYVQIYRRGGEPTPYDAVEAGHMATQPQGDSHDGRPTNRLIHETSPYLLQHAHNPVNWYAWGPEALAQAKREDKPIFLSIGYSTCYWCHVMERECFERQEVADILNKYFIAIKVDREERPDIDEQYMIATQLITRRGGWPNSLWLTPDGRPWMAGTYYPREQFIDLLTQLADMWRTRRAEVEQRADQLAEAIRQVGSGAGVEVGLPVNQDLLDQAVASLQQAFDATNGGFGRAPKFPPHGPLRLLVHQFGRSEDPELLKIITRTLDAMATGGVRDHIGGGFHRYATDDHWLVPHFEKMLYDNAQLMRAYTDGFLLTGDRRYRQAVEDIFAWVDREMTDPGGGFHSAIDAGAVGEEGRFYVWRYDEVLEVLGKQDGKSFAEAYGLRKGGNFQEEATGRKTGANIVHLPGPAQPEAGLKAMRDKLLAVRNRRRHPHKDDKVLAGWNGLMIAGLAYAGGQLDEPRYTRAAARAAEFILDNMMTKEGGLLRSYRAGQAKLPGYLDDHAFLAEGLLELHEATGERRWLDAARRLADTILSDFEDQRAGGFFFATADHEDLLLRSKNIMGGGNTPSGNGVAVLVLLRLGRLTGQDKYVQAARRALASLSGVMWRSPRGAESLLLAAAVDLESAAEVIEASGPADSDARQVLGPVTVDLFASRLQVRAGQTFYVAVVLEIADGWHIYGPNPGVDFVVPTTISLVPNAAVTAGDIVLPASRPLADPVLGETVEIYEGQIQLLIPLTVNPDAASGPATLQLHLVTQACDEAQCLAPQTATLQLTLDIDPDAPRELTRYPSIFDSLGVGR